MPSAKILATKKRIVKALSESLNEASSIVFADYKGLSAAEDTEMRAAFRKAGVSYRVVKNTVSERAFDALGIDGLADVLKGPTAIAYATDDVVSAPRLVKEYVDKFKKISIKGGVLEGRFVDASVVGELAAIPPLDTLYTQLVSTLLYPITRLAITLNLVAEKRAEGTNASESSDEAPDQGSTPDQPCDTPDPSQDASPAGDDAPADQAAEPKAADTPNDN